MENEPKYEDTTPVAEPKYEDTSPHNAPPSELESGVRGAVQGATLGFSDEAVGAAEALWNVAKGNPKTFGELYRTYRDESRTNNKAAEEANPKSYMAGNIAGGIGSMLVPGLGGANIGKMAALGAAQGLGGSEADLTKGDVGGVVKDTAVGGAIGGAVGGVANAVAPVVGGALTSAAERLGGGLNASAEGLAARALGAERGSIRALRGGAPEAREAGRYALDNKVITPFASTEDKIAATEALRSKAGEGMGNVYKTLDQQATPAFNPLDTATNIENKIGDFYRSPINKGETAQLENTLESVLMRGDEPIPLTKAQELKEELGKVANWKGNIAPTEKNKMANEAYHVVSEDIDNAVAKGAQEINDPNLLNTFKGFKQDYGKTKTLESFLEKKQASEQGNKIFGLKSGVASAVGGAIGGIPGAAIGFGAEKAVGKYGMNIAATGVDRLAKIVNTAPETFGKFAPALKEAAARGGSALGTTSFLLQQTSPEYQEMLKKASEEPQK